MSSFVKFDHNLQSEKYRSQYLQSLILIAISTRKITIRYIFFRKNIDRNTFISKSIDRNIFIR